MARSNIRDSNILFLSQENDCLSFIAEAIAKKLLPPKTQVFSAGLKGGKIDPNAVRVLREIGIVRLGDPGEGQIAVTPRAKCKTWDISDPCRQPTADLDAFPHARDEINNKIARLLVDYWRNLA